VALKTELLACLALPLALAACGSPLPTTGQAVDTAWEALEPNTSSHERANWEAVTVLEIQGSEAAEQFEGEPAPGCPGPEPPANGPIDPAATYWLVVLKPVPATPRPDVDTPSPTAPPLIPEAFVREAQFLVDSTGSRVVARRLACVIY
jgi:hypothetical protein